MRLPNGDRVFLGNKLERYVLNSEHPIARHKAIVFASALGITRANSQVLADALLRAAADADDAIPRGDRGHGEVFDLRFRLQTPAGAAVVASGWIVRRGEDFPRLTSCYIVRAR